MLQCTCVVTLSRISFPLVRYQVEAPAAGEASIGAPATSPPPLTWGDSWGPRGKTVWQSSCTWGNRSWGVKIQEPSRSPGEREFKTRQTIRVESNGTCFIVRLVGFRFCLIASCNVHYCMSTLPPHLITYNYVFICNLPGVSFECVRLLSTVYSLLPCIFTSYLLPSESFQFRWTKKELHLLPFLFPFTSRLVYPFLLFLSCSSFACLTVSFLLNDHVLIYLPGLLTCESDLTRPP